MAMSEVVIARFTLQHIEAKPGFAFVDMRGYWRGRVAELEAAEEKRDEAEAKTKPPEPDDAKWEALDTKFSEPDELQEINNRIDRVKHRHDVQGVQLREQLVCLGEKLDELADQVRANRTLQMGWIVRLEKWSERFASWYDEEHLVKSPRLG